MEETVSTLRFASRMMNVSAEPTALERTDPVTMVKQLQLEVNALRRELAMKDALSNRQPERYEPLTDQQRKELEKSVRKFIEDSSDPLEISSYRQVETVFDIFKKIFKDYEKETEKRLKESQPAKGKGAVVGLPTGPSGDNADEGGNAGELDRRGGFGISGAPTGSKAEPNAVANAKKKEAAQQSLKRQKTGMSDKGQQDDKDHSPQSPTQGTGSKKSSHAGQRDLPSQPTQPGTADISPPLDKNEAFEEFKRGRGQEIQKILTENKEVLVKKKRSYTEIAKKVNTLKAEIDKSRVRLEQLKAEREAEGFAAPVDEQPADEEEIVITEDEFVEIRKLHDLKQKYRTTYDELSSVKSKISYCQHLIDQCRQRLLREFQQWYSDTYGVNLSLVNTGLEQSTEREDRRESGSEMAMTGGASFVVDEDEGERFERRQRELLMENPEQYSFAKARQRADHRVAQQPPTAFTTYNQYKKTVMMTPIITTEHWDHPYKIGNQQPAPSPLPVGLLTPKEPNEKMASKGARRLPPMPAGV